MDLSSLTALAEVIVIDLLMAADNAVAVGLAVAGLPNPIRKKAILIGLSLAVGLRIIFSLFTAHLLQFTGLSLAGGVLLLWIAIKMGRGLKGRLVETSAPVSPDASKKSLFAAIWQMTIADLSMSFDNILAIAGVARDHTTVLIIGLVLSVALMGFLAHMIAVQLQRRPWLAYLGVALLSYVALHLIVEGTQQILLKLA